MLGQTLIPDDITVAEGNPRWLACKTTGDGDCLFNSMSRVLVGNESLCCILRLLTAVELYINSEFYCKHPAFQEYVNASVINGYDEDTLFTMCLTAQGIAAWNGKHRDSAVKEEAKSCSKQREWCGTFHIMALASVTGRPVYSVYPNAGSRIREFFHRKILPRSLEQGNQDVVYIMWSRYGTLDSAPGSWYQPNHFIPIVKIPRLAASDTRIPGDYKKFTKTKPPLSIKRQSKGWSITNFFTKKASEESHQTNNSLSASAEAKLENCVEDSKGAKTKKLDDTSTPGSADPVKHEAVKTAPTRRLTCSTVEKWKRQDLAQYEAESWLIYDEEKTTKGQYCIALKCNACIQFESIIRNRPKFSRAFIDGSTNFRLTNVVDHAKSDTHKIAFSLYNKKQGQSPKTESYISQQNQSKLDFSLNPQQIEDLKRKFDISYFVVKEELPLSKYEKIIALEKRHGVPHGSTYSNRAAATEFISFQSKEVLTQLSRDVLKSKFYSILFDSTTDKTVSEQEAVFVLYFERDPTEPQLSGDHEPMVHVKLGFLSLENLKNSTAQGVLEGIKTSLKNLGLPNVGEIPPIPVGLGGDGCSTNRGETNGVQALFKKEYSWCLFVWCVAHRLELALKDALTNTYFKKVDEVLLRLYYLYENSPKKLRGLKELHLAYKDTFQFVEGSVKPKRASGTRWISHKLAALKLLVDKLGLFIQHLETLSSDRSVKSSDQAKLKGYLKEWKSAKLFVYSCFFVDLLQPAAVLSQAFQGEDVDAVTVASALSKVKKQLNSLQDREACTLQTVRHYLGTVEANDEYQGVRLSNISQAIAQLKEDSSFYVNLLNDAIEARLGGSNEIASIAIILNCEAWDASSSCNESIDEIILHYVCHFEEPLRQQGLQATQLELVNEWHDMLDYTVQYLSPSSRHYKATWFKIFHSSRAREWQNILLLIRIFFTLPVSNAALERMFSNLGRVKTAKRSSLSQGTLENILRIQAGGPPLESYDPSTAINDWDRRKRRRTNQKPRKEYKVRRSTRTVAYDGLKQDVPEEDTSEASDDNSNCSLFRSDDEEDNIE